MGRLEYVARVTKARRLKRETRFDGWSLAVIVTRFLALLCIACVASGATANEENPVPDGGHPRWQADFNAAVGYQMGEIRDTGRTAVGSERAIGEGCHDVWRSTSSVERPDSQLNPFADAARQGRGWRRRTRDLVVAAAECDGGDNGALGHAGGVIIRGDASGGDRGIGDHVAIDGQAECTWPNGERLRSPRAKFPGLQLYPFADAALLGRGWRRRTRNSVNLARIRGEGATYTTRDGGTWISAVPVDNDGGWTNAAVVSGSVVGRGRRSVRPHISGAECPDLQLYPTADSVPLGRGWRWWTRSQVALAAECVARAMGTLTLISAVDFLGAQGLVPRGTTTHRYGSRGAGGENYSGASISVGRGVST